MLEDSDIRFISSSHGWITLCNERNCDLFLWNPLSDSLVKLPPIHTLDIEAGFQCVSKVITSCSPEQQHCRVMMSFGPYRRLAFCTPTSTEWTPIGYYYSSGKHDNCPVERGYQDFVYSTRDKLFYCVDTLMGFEAWNPEDTRCPMISEFNPSTDDDNYPWPVQSDEEVDLKSSSNPSTFLVVAEESGDILWVKRHIMPHIAPDGSYLNREVASYAAAPPYKTVGFDVHKYDVEKDALVYMDGELDGLAIFIGNNHSFSISASDCPRLIPNSIYFTDVNELIPEVGTFGGHDIGIFNYQDKTFPSCYYPSDKGEKLKRIVPPPMWFTPTS